MNTIRTAVVGLGGMGLEHTRRIADVPAFQLVAASDPGPSAADAAAEHLPGVPFFADHRLLLESARPELLIIVTPHDLHAPIALDAFAAGCHVLAEKPMATTVADCRAMLEAARTAGRMLTVYNNRRLDPWFVAVRDAVHAGRIGEVLEAHVSWPGYFGPETWRGWKARSGGLFYDLGAHITDWALEICRSAPLSVSGEIARVPGGDPGWNEDIVRARVRLQSGALVTVTVSALDRAPADRFRIVGSTGTIVDAWNWNGGAAQLLPGRAFGTDPAGEIPYGPAGPEQGNEFYRRLAAHLREGAPLLVPPERPADVVRIFELVEASASRGGGPVEW